MKFLKPFNVWIENNSINENIAAAKSYIQKKEADKLGKTPEELTPEEREAALNNRKYRAIIDLVKNAPGYAGAFVKFAFDQEIAIDQLAELLVTLKTKKHIIAQLPKSIDQYATEETVNRLTGFEKMQDDIRTIERSKESKWLIDRLPRALRAQYQTLSPEDKSVLINAAQQLTELGDKAIKRLLEKVKAFDAWKLEDVIEYINKYIGGFANLEMQKKIDSIYSLEPEAGVIYSDDQYLVISVRTEKAQKELCSVANWCINRGSFSSYANDGVQLNIFNFGTDPSDPLFLTGTTIYYNGKVRTAHDINDKMIMQSADPREHFTKLGYPSRLIDTIVNNFPIEVLIKKIVTEFKIDTTKPLDFLLNVIYHSYTIDLTANETALSVVMDIIENRIKNNVTRSQVINMYITAGIFSKFSAKLLSVLLDDITPEELKKIKDATLALFAKLKTAIKTQPNLANIPRVKNILVQEEAIMDELNLTSRDARSAMESLQFDPSDPILEFFMDGPLVKPAPTKTPVRKPMTPSRPSPIPSKQPFKAPEPAKAEAEDVLKRLDYLTDEEL